MYVITVNNVRHALPEAYNIVKSGELENTRGGQAFTVPYPVTIRYLYPKEHVLIDPARDANPFFHLMEAIWMLAGNNDAAFLDRYIKDFSKNYADAEGTVPDAYGYRWREALGYDQLLKIIEQLRKDPTSRQCVLQMWGAGRDDLLEPQHKPCNLVATFRVVRNRLNMMVANRSNDLIWGCCGANAVHFAIMQEYVAQMCGFQLGDYWQVTSNLHLYMKHVQMINQRGGFGRVTAYGATQPLIDKPDEINIDIFNTVTYIDDMFENGRTTNYSYIKNLFLRDVVCNMALAHYQYKQGDIADALVTITKVTAPDWQHAGYEWLMRRTKNA